MDSLDSAEAINFCQGTLSESSAEAAISNPDTFCVWASNKSLRKHNVFDMVLKFESLYPNLGLPASQSYCVVYRIGG